MYELKFRLNLHSLYSKGIGLWCNGNTTVFGAVFLGSSPSRPTKTPQEIEEFFILFYYFQLVFIVEVFEKSIFFDSFFCDFIENKVLNYRMMESKIGLTS